MNNLAKFIALDKLLESVGHGRVNLDLSVRSGLVVGVIATGTKKTLYNASTKDENTNQTALEYIVRRISHQLESNSQWEINFKVTGKSDKMKTIEVTSKQTL